MTDWRSEETGVERAELRARQLLLDVGAALAGAGMPQLEARGKLIRPIVALAGLRGDPAPTGFAYAVASIQLAHEASLVHDDIIDGAAERRGARTLVAERGVAPALVHGDHLLTAAYRAAAETKSLAWATTFAQAVERTVAGESRQGALAGRRVPQPVQREIHADKSGQLFGCAFAAAAILEGGADAQQRFVLGQRLGQLYQRMDDLLDYLPNAGTGKAPLSDYRQRCWTWPLDVLGVTGFDDEPEAVMARFRQRDEAGLSPLDRALAILEAEANALLRDVAQADTSPLLEKLLQRWLGALRAAAGSPAVDTRTALSLPPVPAEGDAWIEALAKGSRSFRFAARLFPPDDRRRVAGVYAFCRYTDDLVDGVENATTQAIEARLDAWAGLARRAYAGERTGNGLVDAVMADAARADVPFRYVDELVDGMRMDLRPRTYRDLAELRQYTFRVASVVGLWLTELHGIHGEAVLDRAATLGHAMQLTNILRDVGEDLDAGRVYLPASMLSARGLDRGALERMRAGEPILPSYVNLVEELMAIADAWYHEAFDAIPALPVSFQRPVAVAAHVYQGIHDAIRRNGYDNLRRRAYTRGTTKVRLGLSALLDLRATRRRSAFLPAGAAPAHDLSEALFVEGASGTLP